MRESARNKEMPHAPLAFEMKKLKPRTAAEIGNLIEKRGTQRRECQLAPGPLLGVSSININGHNHLVLVIMPWKLRSFYWE